MGFEVAKYDAGRALFIDPTVDPLIYSTYLGGSGSDTDNNNSIAVDSGGNAYVTGSTSSIDFPITTGAFQTTCNNCNNYNAFVTKLNATGSAFVYSTYLGGSGGLSEPGAIAVDTSGNAYVIAVAGAGFPVTPGAFQPTLTCDGDYCFDNFVTKLNPSGSALAYSTYLSTGGGTGPAIAVDSAGGAYVTGQTVGTFPVTPGAFQTRCCGAFVAKLNTTGSALVYGTYLGGSGGAVGTGIAVDSAGNAYITGFAGENLPVTSGAFQTTCCGAFVAKFNPLGSALIYSTYLGGSDVYYATLGTGIAVDDAGSAYVTGWTASPSFPVTPGAFQMTCRPCGTPNFDSFVTKFDPTGSYLVYSSYLGGSFALGSGIAVNSTGYAYVTGLTEGGFPVTPNAFQKTCIGRGKSCPYSDAFVTKVNQAGTALVYSSYLGGSAADSGAGIAVDGAGNAYVVGNTSSDNFPTTSGAFQTAYSGSGDAFVSKLNVLAPSATTLSSSPNPSVYSQTVTLTATVTSSVGVPADGDTVTFEQGSTELGAGTLAGGSASFTTSSLKVGADRVSVVYGGDSNFGGSTSKAVKQVVSKATSSTTLVSSQNPSNYEQSVTFTATVAPQFSGTPTGKVSFYNGTTLLKSVSLSGGVAEYKTSTLPVGTDNITATYNGSTDFTTSSASLTQTVN